MNLLFDLVSTQPLGKTKRHGAGIYGEIIFKRMSELGKQFYAYYDSTKWINPEIMTICSKNNIKLFDLARMPLVDIVVDNHIDRVYSCLPSSIPSKLPCELYGTLHGLRFLETPNDDVFYNYKHSFKENLMFWVRQHLSTYFRNRRYRQMKEEYVDKDMHLIVVSNHTYSSLLSFYPEMADKDIRIFYSPDTSSKSAVSVNNGENYFLLVSGNRWVKNNVRAIEAFDNLVSKGLIKNVKMKITGAKGTEYKYVIQNPECFEFLGYVEDSELANLYANAYLLVYPSLNEGFGYPPLEAMNFSTPVICSAISSTTEICSGGVLFFNPFSVDEIMTRMLLMMNEDIHNEYSEKGHKRFLEIQNRQIQDLDALVEYITE